MIKALLRKEIQCLFASPQSVWVALTFCLGVFLIFPFVVETDTKSLVTLFPALLWISLFFSLFLTVEGFYSQDYAHQIFHHLYTKQASFLSLVFIKVAVHSVFVIGLHLLMLPFLALFYQTDFILILSCLPYLMLGVASLTLLIHFAHILILALNQRGMLSLLILLPLIVPILIFGSTACQLTLQSGTVETPFYYLSGFFLLTLGVMPYTSATILTEAVKQ